MLNRLTNRFDRTRTVAGGSSATTYLVDLNLTLFPDLYRSVISLAPTKTLAHQRSSRKINWLLSDKPGFMRKHYVLRQLHYLTCMYALGSVVNLQAQSTQPPVSQWQYIVDRSEANPANGQPRLAKATNGEYGVLSGNTLTRLSLTGKSVWSKPVPGLYADSSRTRVPIQETIGLSATQDGGFVMLVLDAINRYYVTKLDSSGNEAWTRLVARADAGPSVQIKETALVVTADGGLLLAGSYTDVLSYLTLTRLNAEGLIVNQWRVNYAGPTQLVTPAINQLLATPDNGYLLTGHVGGATVDSRGLALRLSAQLAVTWQKTYTNLSTIQRVVENPTAKGTYIAVGSGPGNNASAITLAPEKPEDGQLLAFLPGMSSVVSLVNDGTGAVTVLDASPANNGDSRLTNGRLPTAFAWTKTYGGSGTDTPTDILATDDGGYLVVGTTTSTDGDIVGKSTGTPATWVLKIGTAPQATTLRILPPAYNCQTGYISFQTSGGDGSPITYTTPGIGRANTTDTFGTVDDDLRNNTMTITIQATQSGQTVRYTVDLAASCQTSPPTTSTAVTNTLKLIPPTYNCQTGAITFHTVGGDGSPVEYAATGITDWTRNPSQFVEPALRTAANIEPLHLMARQSGQTVMYVFDLKAACGRARSSAEELTADIHVTLLGNPVCETAMVSIVGAGGQLVGFRLFDTRGQLLEQRTIEQAGQSEQQLFDLHQQATGTFLLHTTVQGQVKTLKIVKQ